jgi:hypothetical protein
VSNKYIFYTSFRMSTTAGAAPAKADSKPTKADGSQITVTSTPLPEKETAEIASPSQTEWRITIKSADGATSEVMLSPVSAKSPIRQEINIYMPGAKATGNGGDVEKAKADDVSNI